MTSAAQARLALQTTIMALKRWATQRRLSVHLRCWLIRTACVLAFASPLAAKSWRVTDFRDTITIQKDGGAMVDERMTLAFVGEFHGIHRTIPVEYPGPNGTNYRLFVKVLSVTDENGAKLRYDSSNKG